MARLVLRCKLHQVTIEPLLPTNHEAPASCPICTRHTDTRGWDEYDDLKEKYNLSRRASYSMDVFLREHLNEYSGSLESQLIQRFKVIKHSNGYTPITCSCSNCGTTFRYFATLPTTHSAPTYCPYCGKNSITVHQDSDLDCWEVLARHYNMTPPMIKVFYQLFTSQNAKPRFSDFVALIKVQYTERKLNANQ